MMRSFPEAKQLPMLSRPVAIRIFLRFVSFELLRPNQRSPFLFSTCRIDFM
jgi:hypothetical protein